MVESIKPEIVLKNMTKCNPEGEKTSLNLTQFYEFFEYMDLDLTPENQRKGIRNPDHPPFSHYSIKELSRHPELVGQVILEMQDCMTDMWSMVKDMHTVAMKSSARRRKGLTKIC